MIMNRRIPGTAGRARGELVARLKAGPDIRRIEAPHGILYTETNPMLLIINHIVKNEPNFNV